MQPHALKQEWYEDNSPEAKYNNKNVMDHFILKSNFLCYIKSSSYQLLCIFYVIK